MFLFVVFVGVLGLLLPPTIRGGPVRPPYLSFDQGRTRVWMCSSEIVRVTRVPNATATHAHDRESLVAKRDWEPFQYSVSSDVSSEYVEITTDHLRIRVRKEDARIRFFSSRDENDAILLEESSSTFRPTMDGDRMTYSVEQSWTSSGSDDESEADEGLYGGGEFQNGLLNYKYAPISLVQFNTEAIVPFFVSTKGYGLLWDNYARSFLNPPEIKLNFSSASSSSSFSSLRHATFETTTAGVHHFFVDACPGSFGCGSTYNLKMWATSSSNVTVPILEWDGLSNLPSSLTGRARLQANTTYVVYLNATGPSFENAPPNAYVNTPSYGKTTLRSDLGDSIDYYFTFSAPSAPLQAIARGYREITGSAPIYPKWVYGFWQCREHYASQAELLNASLQFRKRHIPVDSIVQDWHYWGNLGWGPQWDPAVYPAPAEMVRTLHEDYNMRLMVSVWSKFDTSTRFYEQMESQGFMLGTSEYYDPWNPAARAEFYAYSKQAMFDIGVDALWLDATEPEGFPNENASTFLGSGNSLFNTYSLMTTAAIADGLRLDFPDEQGARVFSLTRSSFAGQQRAGAVLWSGDVSGAWDSLRRQVGASLNYAASGMPYWSEDIGGFFRPKDQYTSEDYRHLLMRWFQFGVFTPIFRVHGGNSHTEIWNYGDDAERVLNDTISLRYRLLPYVYSGFRNVETAGDTMQRALPLAFPKDPATYDVADQFMFGDAFMVCPIVSAEDDARQRRDAYFPASTSWIDFWTGETVVGNGTKRSVEAPLAHSPLFVRAGSIVALGDFAQHTEEKPWDPLEIRVYSSDEDAAFVLYEDDGASRDYRVGSNFTTIAFRYDAESQTLVVDDRSGGGFDGMLETRTIRAVLVDTTKGVGLDYSDTYDATFTYTGKRMEVKLR